MVEEVIKIRAEVGEANKEIKKVGQSVDDLKDKANKTEKETKKIAAGFKNIGMAIKAAGIGLVIAAFTKLTSAMNENQKFADGISKVFITIKTVFNQLIQTMEPLVSAFQALFSGDWEGVTNNLSEFTHEIVNFSKNIGEATKEAYAYADALVDLQNKAAIAEAKGRQLILVYQLQAEELRQIRDDESRTIEERIRANTMLGDLLNKQMEVELKNAQQRYDVAELQLSQNKDNVELQVALIDAETELIDIRERIAGQRSEQLTNENALLKEQFDMIAEMKEYTSKIQNDSNAKEIQNKIAATKILNDQEIARSKVYQEQAKVRAEIDEFEKNAKISIAVNTASAIANLFGRESAAGKAAAVAMATINTYQAATNALANTPLPPPFPQIAAAATIASGLAQVRGILQTQIPNGFGGNSVGGSFGMPSFQAASVNIPGQSGINSIISGMQNNNQAIKAYVVTGEVTSGQELERKRLNNATFG